MDIYEQIQENLEKGDMLVNVAKEIQCITEEDAIRIANDLNIEIVRLHAELNKLYDKTQDQII